MWLAVVTPQHGLVNVEMSHGDPSVYDVRQRLQRILKTDMSHYDLMLGADHLTDSMSLADYGLTDGNSCLSMLPRQSINQAEEEVDAVSSCEDPIEDYSPNISQKDPIECTPVKNVRKRKQKRSATKKRKRSKTTCATSTSRDLLDFPKWHKHDA